MAIKGLTDQRAAFPIVGILRKGEEKKSNAPGKDLTYFRFVSDDEDAKRHFNAAYPDQDALRQINVLFPYKTADENLDAWIESWVAGGLVYRSDGENIVLWRTPSGGYSMEEKPDTVKIGSDGKREDKSGQVGRMSVIVPELGRLTTITVLTTSKHDIKNLSSQLKSYEAINGDLRGIPFVLMRRKYQISTPGQDGKRVRREKWLLSIETQPHYTRLHLAAIQRQALPATIDEADYEIVDDEPKQLPVGIIPPFDESEQDDEEVQLEFASLDDLLYQLNQDFGLGESQAKDLLKELGFNGFKKSASAGMYEAVRVALQDVEDVEVIETDPINSDNPVLSEIFTDAPQIPGTEKLTGGGAAYTE